MEKEKSHNNKTLIGNWEIENTRVQNAKEILGQDFLGIEAVRNLERWLEDRIGTNVEFLFNNRPKFPYSEKDIKLAKGNERLIIRPDRIKSENSVKSVNLATLIGYLDKAGLNSPKSLLIPNSYDFGAFFKYNFREDFNSGLSLVSKIALETWYGYSWSQKHEGNGIYNVSCPKYTTWTDQNQALKDRELLLQRQGAKNFETHRRSITEICFDSLLLYANKGEYLLEKQGEWSRSEGLYATFDSNSNGFNISSHWRGYRVYLDKDPAGVYSSR